jgi:hypothetical protein
MEPLRNVDMSRLKQLHTGARRPQKPLKGKATHPMTQSWH